MPTEQQDLSPEQKDIVGVGASVGAGCQPCLSHHLKAGAQAGLAGAQLLAAVASAERVAAEAAVALRDHARGKLAARIHRREAQRLLDTLEPDTAAPQTAAARGGGCGCGADDETEEPTVEDPEPVAATKGQASGCGGMAAHFAAAGSSGSMAGCREMFERFISGPAPAETDKAPTTTTAAGSCKKEA